MNKLILIIFFLAPLGVNAQKENTECLDSKRVSRLSQSYNWYDEAGEIPRAGKGWLCNPKTFPHKIFKALIAMENLPLLDLKKDAFNRNAFGKSATAYIKARVKNFIFMGNTGGCDGETAAYVIHETKETVFLCDPLKVSSIEFIMDTLIHEARHLDAHGYRHVTCAHGSAVDTRNCDDSYDVRGAYGVGAEFSVRLSRTAGVPDSTRAVARANAVSTFLESFNKLPLGLAVGVYAQTKEQSLWFLSPNLQHKILDKVPSGVLAERAEVPVWFEKSSGEVVSGAVHEQGQKIIPAPGTFAKEFRESWSPQKRADVKDLIYSPYFCVLVGGDILCEKGEEKVQVEGLPARPVAFFSTGRSILVSLENNEVYPLPQEFQNLKGRRLVDFGGVQLPQKFTSLVMLGGSYTYMLDSRNELWVMPGADFERRRTYLPQMRFEKIVGPVLWSPQLRDL